MKYIVIALCCAFTLIWACQKEKEIKGIYTPKGTLVANSLEELTRKVAEATHVSPEDMIIKDISFIETEEGFIAELDVWFKSTQLANRAYYVSPELLPKITFEGETTFDGSLSEAGIQERLVALPVIYCSCGNNNFASSACNSIVVQTNRGTITGKCEAINCPSGCYVHIAM